MSSIKNLSYKVGNFELNIPELELGDSGVTALVGDSGSGKTTLLRVLIGLHEPNGWQWTFKGEELSRLPMSDRRLGVVFQSYDLFPHLSAEENVMLVLKARHIDRASVMSQLLKWKSQLNLENCWQTKAQNLSGGEKQRVALLRALVSNPRMLLLDEPFSALDVGLRVEARQMVREIISALDISVLLVTHDLEDVKALAQREVRLSAGRVVSVQ